MRTTDKLKEVNEFRHRLRLKQIVVKNRECLKCTRPFLSTGSWNRLCTGCNQLNQDCLDVEVIHNDNRRG